MRQLHGSASGQASGIHVGNDTALYKTVKLLVCNANQPCVQRGYFHGEMMLLIMMLTMLLMMKLLTMLLMMLLIMMLMMMLLLRC